MRSGSRDPQLRVEGLSVELRVERGSLPRTPDPRRALDRVDLRVLRGQTVAVVGEAGAGKTTLGRAIAQLVPIRTGRVLLAGKDLAALDKAAQSQALAQILLVTADALTGPESLAALCSRETKLLIFDQAFDAVEAVARLQLLAEIRRLQDEQGMSCLVLTRSLEVAGALSDEVVVMHQGQLVETGATPSVVGHPQHPYTRSLLVGAGEPATPSFAAEARVSGCRFRARCAHAFARCASEEPPWFGVPGGLSRCFLHEPDLPDR